MGNFAKFQGFKTPTFRSVMLGMTLKNPLIFVGRISAVFVIRNYNNAL